MLDHQVIGKSDGAVLTAQTTLGTLFVQVQDKRSYPLRGRLHAIQQMLNVFLRPQWASLHAFTAQGARAHLLASLDQIRLKLATAIPP
jgi:hypothetical protein